MEFCLSGVAVRLARKRTCLAVDLDSKAGILRKYLPLNAMDREMPELFHHRLSSLEALKTKSHLTNIEFMEWAAPPPPQMLLRLMAADSSDYVLASLGPEAKEKGIDLFCAADISVIVTRPAAEALGKVSEFLRRTSAPGRYCGCVYILLNRALLGSEEREMSEWMESAQKNLGIKLGFLGAVTYHADPEPALQLVTPLSGLGPQGVGGSAFEDIALKIERLLPRDNRFHIAKSGKRKSGFLSALLWPFERDLRQLQDQIRHRDEFISRLQLQHPPAQELARLSARISQLDADLSTRLEENEQLKGAVDAVTRERDAFRQIEENYRREILELRDHMRRMEGSNQLQEKTLGILEEAISRLKFELMSTIDTKATKTGPAALLRARQILIEKLRMEPPQSITIVSIESAGTATFEFSVELRSILETCGWAVKFMQSPFENGQFYGLQVVNDGSEPALAAAIILGRAFEAAGLAFFRRTAPATANLSAFRLIIGRANWNLS